MSASSDYLNVLTHLTESQGQQQAEAVRAKAQATAEAQRANAQIWGQTISNLGQYVSQIPSQMLEAQKAKTQAAIQQSQLDALKRAQTGQQNVNQILSTMMADGPDGIKTLDRNKLRQAMASQNVPLNLQSDTLKSLDEVDASLSKFQTSKVDHTADIANSILSTHKAEEPITPEAVHLGLAIAKANGLADDDSIAKINDLLAQGADPRQVLMTVRNQSEKYKPKPTEFGTVAEGGTIYNKATGETVGTPTPKKPKTWAEMGLDAQDPNSPTQAASQAALEAHAKLATPKAVSPGSFEDFVIKKFGPKATPDQILKARGDYGRADDRVAGAQAADITNLTPAGIDMAALNYRKTGQLPPLGMGDRTTRQKILNRAAELTPTDISRIEAGGTDVAANKAGYRADSGSLVSLQKQRDAIGAFEGTAQKNIDNFLAVAQKVPDTGIPLLNTPVRWIAGAGGSADMAKYNAARQVAVSEIAKIVQNPNLSGQLSDSARKEIEVFNPSNATLGQTIAVMNLLKQDMNNRKTSLDEQLKATKDRIGGGTTTVQPTMRYNPATGKVEPIQ
jgi:hypothetical protein